MSSSTLRFLLSTSIAVLCIFTAPSSILADDHDGSSSSRSSSTSYSSSYSIPCSSIPRSCSEAQSHLTPARRNVLSALDKLVHSNADDRPSALESLAKSVAQQAVLKNQVKDRCERERQLSASSAATSPSDHDSTETMIQSLADSILSSASNALNISISLPAKDDGKSGEKAESEVSTTQTGSPSSVNIASALSSVAHRAELCARAQGAAARSSIKTQMALTRLILSLGSKDVDARTNDMADAIEKEVDDRVEASVQCKEERGEGGGVKAPSIGGLSPGIDDGFSQRPPQPEPGAGPRQQQPPRRNETGFGTLMDPPFSPPFANIRNKRHDGQGARDLGGGLEQCRRALGALNEARKEARSASEDFAGAIDYRRASKDCPTLLCMELRFGSSIATLTVARLDVIQHCPCRQEEREEKKHEEFNQPGPGPHDSYSSDTQPGIEPPQIFNPQNLHPPPIHTQSGDPELPTPTPTPVTLPSESENEPAEPIDHTHTEEELKAKEKRDKERTKAEAAKAAAKAGEAAAKQVSASQLPSTSPADSSGPTHDGLDDGFEHDTRETTKDALDDNPTPPTPTPSTSTPDPATPSTASSPPSDTIHAPGDGHAEKEAAKDGFDGNPIPTTAVTPTTAAQPTVLGVENNNSAASTSMATPIPVLLIAALVLSLFV